MEQTVTGIDSVVSFRNSQGVRGRGTLVHITRSMAVFEVYNPFSVVQLSEVMQEVIISRGERVIYRGKGVVTSIVTTGLMTIVSATFTDSWSDPGSLRPGKSLESEIEDFINGWEKGHDLSPSYQLIVNKMGNFFAEISRWIEEVEVALLEDSRRNQVSEESFRNSIERPVIGKVGEFFRLFENEARKIPPEEVPVYKAFARRELHPFLLCAPFAHRTFSKPLGYAGDYEMVNMMLQESPTRGNNTYAQIFQDIQTNVAACKAHRNRIDFLQSNLSREAERVQSEMRACNILNVGCGPAVEVQRFIREDEESEECVFTLMDFNEETLAYTQGRVKAAIQDSGRQPVMKFVQRSIDELLKDVHDQKEEIVPTYDIVYCAGLFDYFPDNVCRNLVSLYYRWVKPGGLLMATNVTPHNPDRCTMEHLLEWYLIYRDEETMASLAPSGTSPQIETDETGVNVFLSIRKP
ncbi:MAG: class I SAM-dependent methyltransferase [Puniceicoccales bacterium]